MNSECTQMDAILKVKFTDELLPGEAPHHCYKNTEITKVKKFKNPSQPIPETISLSGSAPVLGSDLNYGDSPPAPRDGCAVSVSDPTPVCGRDGERPVLLVIARVKMPSWEGGTGLQCKGTCHGKIKIQTPFN